MLFLWIATSVQKVVLLDDLGLLEPKGSSNRPASEDLFHRGSSGYTKAQEGAYYGGTNVLHNRRSSLPRENTFVNSTHTQDRRGPDVSQAVKQYLAKGSMRPLGISGRQMQGRRGSSATRDALDGRDGGGRRLDARAGSYAYKYRVFPQNSGSIDIDVPYRSQEGDHRDEPGQYSGNSRGIETGTKPRGGYQHGDGHYGDMQTGGDGPPKGSYSSILHGAEDTESANDFERNARENIENANSARESYLEVKIRESQGRESKIAEELNKVDEQIETFVNSLGETRMKAQKTQIDLLNRRNSVKNMVARREASEKAVRKLNAEMRILNNEVVRLSKELDDKKIRLENLGEDVNMQNNRVRSIEDEIVSRNNEVEQDEAKKNDLNKDIIRIENTIAKLKEERDGLTRERSRESRVQSRLQREIDKIGEAGVFV